MSLLALFDEGGYALVTIDVITVNTAMPTAPAAAPILFAASYARSRYQAMM